MILPILWSNVKFSRNMDWKQQVQDQNFAVGLAKNYKQKVATV